MVLTHNLCQRIMHGAEKVLIGVDHATVRRKLDQRHRTTQGVHDAFVLMFGVDTLRDVRRHFDHAADLLVGANDRHIAGLKPDFTAAFIESQVGATHGFALTQRAPKSCVLFASGVRLFAK